MKKEIYDIIIIGGGVAGLAAGIYSKRLNLKSLVIRENIGGTLMNAPMIENYPGFVSISGKALINKTLEHAKSYDVDFFDANVEKVSKEKNLFFVKTKKTDFFSKTILLCTGTEWKKLDVPGEKEYAGRGVHYCALCDGFFYKNKTVAVVGGSDSAVKEALLLSNYAKKIYLLSRNKIRAEPINLKRIQNEPKIEVIAGAEIKEIKSDKSGKLLIFKKKIKGSDKLDVDGIFIEIGRAPNSSLAENLGVKLDKNKFIITDKKMATNIKGVFSAGDVTDTHVKQAITGVGDSVKAVYSIYEYLKKEEIIYD